MTNPNPEQQQEEPRRKQVRRGQVVSLTVTDAILGTEYEDLGVVLAAPADGGPVVVRLLSTVDAHVDPAKVAPVSTDDVPQV